MYKWNDIHIAGSPKVSDSMLDSDLMALKVTGTTKFWDLVEHDGKDHNCLEEEVNTGLSE